MFTLNPKSRSRWMLLLLLLVAGVTNTLAQNVTISPKTGKLVAAYTYDGEVGFENGWSSMWRHEQLPLSFTVADDGELTGGGELAIPAGNMSFRTTGTGTNQTTTMVIMGGQSKDLYCVLALPKGYKIKSYKMVLVNNLNGQTVNNAKLPTGVTKVMYETHSDFDTSNAWTQTSSMGGSNSNTEYAIQRTSLTDNDMGNVLYFRMTHTGTNYFGVTVKSFEINFTAAGPFQATVAPGEVGPAVSLAEAPFTTSKTDIGALTPNTKNGKTYYSYEYTNVQDMKAYTYLYQDDALVNGEPSDVATTKNIAPVEVGGQLHYALKNDVYYIETPVEVHSQTGLAAPVGYRITDARFECLWGDDVVGGTKTINDCEIKYTSGGKTYYLNGQLHFTEEPFSFELDEENRILNGNRYLSCYGETDQRDLSYATEKTQFNLKRASDGKIYYISSSGTYYYLQWYNAKQVYYGTGWYERSGNGWSASYTPIDEVIYNYNWNDASATPKVVKSTSVDRTLYYREYGLYSAYSISGCYNSDYVVTESTSHSGRVINFAPYKHGKYTLKVYDATGTTVKWQKTVNGPEDLANDAGVCVLSDYTDLNNDAVKFAIEDLTEDDPDTEANEATQALVSVTLTMESLNPYINSMDIVCQDEDENLELRQTFTADDFSVSGGVFTFYVPTDYAGKNLKFSFRDLYTPDGDDTYGGTGKARYSFVTSPYFQAFDRVAGNATAATGVTYDFNINDATDNSLYDSRFNDNISSTHKIYALKAGNIRFKFNNAEDLKNDGGQSGTNYLKEEAFTVAKYLDSKDPDFVASEDNPDEEAATGAFNQILMNSDPNNESGLSNSGIYYVFTSDETRYNIAPGNGTTPHAWEHRTYAFYRMDINLEAKQYVPALEWTQVYGTTSYADQDDSGKDIEGNKPMWGLTLKAKDTNNNNQIIDVADGVGYLSAQEIIQALEGTKDDQGQYVVRHVGPSIGEDGAPATKDQILYIDASKLKNVVSSANFSLETLRNELAPNSLVYLPKNMTSTADNFAYYSGSGESAGFVAGRNIVLQDRKPFYAPYDIQVQAAPHHALYTRNVTWAKNGKVTNATLLVPFEIAVADGLHDDGEGNKFTVHQIAGDKALSPTATKEIDNIHVLPVKGVNKTEPNVPYVVSVSAEDQPSDPNTSFVVKQTGALLKATTSMDKDTYEFTGTSGKGISGKTGVTFTPTGTYSGKVIPRDENKTLYYFGKNMFLKLGTLTSANLYMYPFRAYFTTVGESAAKQLNIFLGENTNPTGINEVETETMFVDPNAPVYDVYGRKIANSVREIAGKKLPRGIYVVNGAKFNVK